MTAFQSTPPVKAATAEKLDYQRLIEISIHAAREGGDGKLILMHDGEKVFQSTPPVKAATICPVRKTKYLAFQSTPPVKAATQTAGRSAHGTDISIHAAREGGDHGSFYC